MTDEKRMTPNEDRQPVENPAAPAPSDSSGAAPPGDQQNDTAFSQNAGASLADIVAECDQNKEKWLRAEAEMENVRRRSRTEIDELRKYQSFAVLREVLAPIDNLRLALNAAETTGNVNELVKGIQMVLSQFDSVFSNHNAKPIESEGLQFDPNLHEALQQIPSADHEPMTVLQEFQRGYKMHDRVLRPSKVIVSSAPVDSTPSSATDPMESDKQSEEETQS